MTTTNQIKGETMNTDKRKDGKYATIQPTKSGMFLGTIIQVWEGYQWYITHCLDTSVAGVHHWLHGHGIHYNDISLKKEL